MAVRSLISLCQIEGNPSLGHDKACSTEKDVPRTVWECEEEASHNAVQGHLQRQTYVVQNNIPSRGRAVSQVEARFSKAKSKNSWSLGTQN